MRQDAWFEKNRSQPVLVALGIEKALRLRLALEKKHLRQVKRSEKSMRRYKYDIFS
jgi:hypothetical protein